MSKSENNYILYIFIIKLYAVYNHVIYIQGSSNSM